MVVRRRSGRPSRRLRASPIRIHGTPQTFCQRRFEASSPFEWTVSPSDPSAERGRFSSNRRQWRLSRKQPMSNSLPPIFTINEAARYCGLHRDRLIEGMRSQALAYLKFEGRSFIRPAEVTDWITSQGLTLPEGGAR